MDLHPISHKLLASRQLSDQDQALLLAAARRVNQARFSGTLGTLLLGRHVAVMAPDDSEAARLFRHAGTEMGAQVALVPALAANSSATDLQTTGRMLSQLYDAVECQGMPATLVRGIAQGATVPVFDGLATAQHPVAALAERVAEDAAVVDANRLVVQAVLLSAIN